MPLVCVNKKIAVYDIKKCLWGKDSSRAFYIQRIFFPKLYFCGLSYRCYNKVRCSAPDKENDRRGDYAIIKKRGQCGKQ